MVNLSVMWQKLEFPWHFFLRNFPTTPNRYAFSVSSLKLYNFNCFMVLLFLFLHAFFMVHKLHKKKKIESFFLLCEKGTESFMPCCFCSTFKFMQKKIFFFYFLSRLGVKKWKRDSKRWRKETMNKAKLFTTLWQ